MNFKRYHVSKNLFPQDSFSGKSNDIRIQFNDVASGIVFNTGQYVFTAKISTELTSGVFKFCYTYTDDSQEKSGWISKSTSSTKVVSNANKTIKSISITDYNSYGDITLSEIMLNTGSTPLPYEPYSSEVWHDTPHYIHKTDTDTLATLPADIYANDTTATVGLKGNMSQTGTPTPDNPIQPQECGERTGNLFDYQTMAGTIKGYYLTDTGDLAETNLAAVTDYIPCNGGVFSLAKVGGILPSICLYDSNKQFLYGQAYNTTGGSDKRNIVVDTNVNAKFIRFSYFYIGTEVTDDLSKIMLVSGTTAPSTYIPYGYKIPILNNSQTTNVYLGEVETTRTIKKLVLTGQEEGWRIHPSISSWFQLVLSEAIVSGFELCTHYQPSPNSPAMIQNGEILVNFDGANNRAIIRDTTYTALDDFKAYLAAQYAAGTPVCVWYVLATPTTGIVNEPIRKIGTYADEISNITIPTIAGANTLSIGTTVQPSEVSVNYKGWHPVSAVHEKSKNLFDKSTVINGKRIDAEGEPFDSETCSLSQFIKVTPSSIINQGYNFSYNDCMAEYDISKAFIARHVSGNGVVTLDNNTHYIRVAVSTLRLDSVMVNEGSTSLPYEPYWT